MVVNGVELEDIDILEADESERFENAIEKVKEIENMECLKNSEAIRMICNSIFDCFNDIFGEGTDKKVFGDKVNLLICIEAFEELIETVRKSNEKAEKFFSKYSPNRVQRRKK